METMAGTSSGREYHSTLSSGDSLELDGMEGDAVDDLLQALEQEVVGDSGVNAAADDVNGSSLSSLDFDFSETMKESFLKFDDFLDRSGLCEVDDVLNELPSPAIEPMQPRKRSRAPPQTNLHGDTASPDNTFKPTPLAHFDNSEDAEEEDEHVDTFDTDRPTLQSSPKEPSRRIRAISGENLSALGSTMNRAYATTSDLGSKGLTRSLTTPQKNATWNTPPAPAGEEPILGEVTGSKMRRLLSNNSYFQSHPTPAPAAASRNAAWNAPKPSVGQGTSSAMRNLLNSTSHVPTRTAASGNASWNNPASAKQPAFGKVSLEEMQRLATHNPFLPTQATASTTGATQAAPQAPAPPSQNNAFGTVTLQEMQRLAGQNPFLAPTTPQAQPAPEPLAKPTLAKVSLEDMQRLAGFAPNQATAPQPVQPLAAPPPVAPPQPVAPTQGASVPGNAAWPNTTAAPKPTFLTVTVEEMQQRLANHNPFGNPTVPTQASAPEIGTAAWPPAAAKQQPNPFLPQQTATTAPAVATQLPQQGGSAAWPSTAAKPTAFASVTVEEMQRLAAASQASYLPSKPNPAAPRRQVPIAPQTAPSQQVHVASQAAPAPKVAPVAPIPAASSGAVTDSASQNAEWSKPGIGKISVEEMQHLANHSPPVTTAQTPSPSQQQPNAAWPHPSKPAPANTGEMARLVSNTSSFPSQETPTEESEDNHNVAWPEPSSPRKVSGGKMQRLLSTNSYFQPPKDSDSATTCGSKNADWPDADAKKSPEDSVGPDEMMKRLQELMQKSSKTQKALQVWDKDNGLPRSHSQTMVNSSRSRRQLQEGKIIPKWDGTPLINDETELGKPKPRTLKKKSSAVNL